MGASVVCLLGLASASGQPAQQPPSDAEKKLIVSMTWFTGMARSLDHDLDERAIDHGADRAARECPD